MPSGNTTPAYDDDIDAAARDDIGSAGRADIGGGSATFE